MDWRWRVVIMGYDDFYYYSRSKPKRVRGGGIRARSRHGKIGDTWWSQRWIETLNSFGWSNRLERGRRYARMGQVVKFTLDGGVVKAKVQGSRPRPYDVEIRIRQITDKTWDGIFEGLGGRASYVAKLLAGEMPHNIEEVFQLNQVTLFPTREELETDCSCPDDANPCKHIAAVYYILAEEFDRDPFMIFRLRGRTKEEVLERIQMARTQGSGTPSDSAEAIRIQGLKGDKRSGNGAKPLSECFDSYWNSPNSKDIKISIAAPMVNAAIVRRLGEPPFWRESKDFTELMEGIYERITRQAVKFAFK